MKMTETGIDIKPELMEIHDEIRILRSGLAENDVQAVLTRLERVGKALNAAGSKLYNALHGTELMLRGRDPGLAPGDVDVNAQAQIRTSEGSMQGSTETEVQDPVEVIAPIVLGDTVPNTLDVPELVAVEAQKAETSANSSTVTNTATRRKH